MSAREAIERFDCFGGSCAVIVAGDGDRAADEAAARARTLLLEWHDAFSRFQPASELCRLNSDARERVPVSPLMAYLAATVRHAAERTDGLVDATLLGEIERVGYADHLPARLPLELALAMAPPRKPGAGAPERRWRALRTDPRRSVVRRPPGLRLDSGGLAKGLFADLVAETLSTYDSFAVDCCGDLAIGGAAAQPRAIRVQSPFDSAVVHTFELACAGVATSGIGRRAWLDSCGRPAHHLLDPATGRPAYTGVVQATALAPTAVLAEIHAKAALLAGPAAGRRWLRWGGVLVLDDGSAHVIEPPAAAVAERAAQPLAA